MNIHISLTIHFSLLPYIHQGESHSTTKKQKNSAVLPTFKFKGSNHFPNFISAQSIVSEPIKRLSYLEYKTRFHHKLQSIRNPSKFSLGLEGGLKNSTHSLNVVHTQKGYIKIVLIYFVDCQTIFYVGLKVL